MGGCWWACGSSKVCGKIKPCAQKSEAAGKCMKERFVPFDRANMNEPHSRRVRSSVGDEVISDHTDRSRIFQVKKLFHRCFKSVTVWLGRNAGYNIDIGKLLEPVFGRVGVYRDFQPVTSQLADVANYLIGKFSSMVWAQSSVSVEQNASYTVGLQQVDGHVYEPVDSQIGFK